MKFLCRLLVILVSFSARANEDVCQVVVDKFNKNQLKELMAVNRPPTKEENTQFRADEEACFTGFQLSRIYSAADSTAKTGSTYFKMVESSSCSTIFIGEVKRASCGGLLGQEVRFRQHFGDGLLRIQGGDLDVLKVDQDWYALVNPEEPDSLFKLGKSTPELVCSFERVKSEEIEQSWARSDDSSPSCEDINTFNRWVGYTESGLGGEVPDGGKNRVFTSSDGGLQPRYLLSLEVRPWSGGCGGFSVTGADMKCELCDGINFSSLFERHRLPELVGFNVKNEQIYFATSDINERAMWRYSAGMWETLCGQRFRKVIRAVLPLRSAAEVGSFSGG